MKGSPQRHPSPLTHPASFRTTRGGLPLPALPALLDAVMKEDAFYTRLREAFNDLFLTLGLDDNAETVLSYDHFEKTRGWAEKYDLSHIADEKERTQARCKLYADYRKALLDEPMKLIEHIVRNDRSFTEIVTASVPSCSSGPAFACVPSTFTKRSGNSPESPTIR